MQNHLVRRLLTTVAAAAALLLSACVVPETSTLYLHNRTSQDIVSVYIREAGATHWGGDLLNLTSTGNVIAPGGRHPFYSIEEGERQIRAVLADHTERILQHTFLEGSRIVELDVK